MIGAVCYEEGQGNPSNACQACAPDANELGWSDAPEGTECATGKACQSGECVAVVATTCAGTTCPAVSGLAVSCNAQDLCEYAGSSGSPMLWVPGGSFRMGANMDGTQCPANTPDVDAAPAELPCHEVAVPGFLVDKTEVTVAAYRAYRDANGGAACTNPGDGLACTPQGPTYETYCTWGVSGKDQHPVNCVTWFQLDGFCRGTGRRLCTEAEWEWAARGSDGRRYPWSSGNTDCPLSWEGTCSGAEWTGSTAKANCEESLAHDGFEGTAPVGSFPGGRSPGGALDMAGNVFEWVQDWWHDTYDGAPADGTAWEAPTGVVRVLRGGGFSSLYDNSLRASYRFHEVPANSSDSLGGRCCRTP
jgi:formylglycine-generating enzyme required for sulfatase activity